MIKMDFDHDATEEWLINCSEVQFMILLKKLKLA